MGLEIYVGCDENESIYFQLKTLTRVFWNILEILFKTVTRQKRPSHYGPNQRLPRICWLFSTANFKLGAFVWTRFKGIPGWSPDSSTVIPSRRAVHTRHWGSAVSQSCNS